MNFEIIDNLFQVLVLFSAMAASAVTACKRKSRLLYDGDTLLCTASHHYRGYPTDLLCGGNLLAGGISVLSISFFIQKKHKGKFSRCYFHFLCGVDYVFDFCFQIFGPALLFSLCFAVTEGTIVLRCMEVIRRERKKHLLDSILLLVSWMQVALYIVSEFLSDYTRFNFYFVVDMVLTLTMASMYFALLREVERE